MPFVVVVKGEVDQEETQGGQGTDQASIDITHTLQLLANASANISNPNASQEQQEVSFCHDPEVICT